MTFIQPQYTTNLGF